MLALNGRFLGAFFSLGQRSCWIIKLLSSDTEYNVSQAAQGKGTWALLGTNKRSGNWVSVSISLIRLKAGTKLYCLFTPLVLFKHAPWMSARSTLSSQSVSLSRCGWLTTAHDWSFLSNCPCKTPGCMKETLSTKCLSITESYYPDEYVLEKRDCS